ncbi:MAG: glycosyltransferase family A protein [Planctomycetota bacterium]
MSVAFDASRTCRTVVMRSMTYFGSLRVVRLVDDGCALLRREAMPTPSISVVIPAYNAEHTIRRAIDSILDQQYPASQIIVVDDGSDRSLQPFLQEYGSTVTLLRQHNAHAAAARNTGIDHANGQWIGFLDADDYWESEKLLKQVEIINRHPEVALIAGRHFLHAPGDIRQLSRNRKRAWFDRVVQRSGPNAFLLATMIWTGMVLVKRSVLDEQRFVSGLEPAEDRDLWFRLAANHSIYLMSQPLATAVLEPNGISRSDIHHDCTKMLEVIERHHDAIGWPWRSIWQSYVRYRWAAMETSPRSALPILIRSIATWPAPYFGLPAMQPLGRLRRLITLLRTPWNEKRALESRPSKRRAAA